MTKDRSVAVVFTLTVFVAASLLFMVQPMVAKGLLPLFGGTPAVWTTAMLFFQAALLGGYSLAHVTLSRFGPRRQSRVQLLVLISAALVLPLAAPAGTSSENPLLSVLVLLATGVGLPFLALSMASPVLQRWFSVSGHPRAGNPYVLYIASNIGSLLALVSYPFVVEPALPLDVQRVVWSALYVLFVALMAACALLVFPRAAAGTAGNSVAGQPSHELVINPTGLEAARRPFIERAGWFVLAFIPSSLMLGVTAFVTTDVASAPFLWVLPLALYLLTYVVAFSRFADAFTRTSSLLLPFFALAVAIDILSPVGLPIALRLPLHLTLFTLAALLCHGRLAASRPQVTRLTEFYLFLALGGVAGGVANAIVAPHLLNVVAEYPLAIAAALFARFGITGSVRKRWLLGAVAVGLFLAGAAIPLVLDVPGSWSSPLLLLLMSVALLFFASSLPFGLLSTVLLSLGILFGPPALLAERNFFGQVRVLEADGEHRLLHGTTVHGVQLWPPEESPNPTGYYHDAGPLGDLFALRPAGGREQIGILGLGVGGMAAYGELGQSITFYEIDPLVAEVAADERYFTFLAATPAHVEVLLGDGRLLVAEEQRGRFDLLIMDAFSSDSIPVHLLTREAFELYVDRLSPRGVLIVHISNRYVDLEPIVSAAARDLGLAARIRQDAGHESADPAERRFPSRWVVLAREPAALAGLDGAAWTTLAATDRPAWTDTSSDIVSVLDWRGDILR